MQGPTSIQSKPFLQFDYQLDEPKSLVIFIPIVSTIVMIFQLHELKKNLPPVPKVAIENIPAAKAFNANPSVQRYRTICQWHVVGDLIQTISLFALAILFNPYLAVGVGFSICATVYTLNNLKNVGYFEINDSPGRESIAY